MVSLHFFLSDCGPSAEVANTLYRGENENLCVRVCLVAVVVVIAGSAKTGSHGGGRGEEEGRKRGGGGRRVNAGHHSRNFLQVL